MRKKRFLSLVRESGVKVFVGHEKLIAMNPPRSGPKFGRIFRLQKKNSSPDSFGDIFDPCVLPQRGNP